jgi:hypothetical protein
MDLQNEKNVYFKVARCIFMASTNTVCAVLYSMAYLLQHVHLPWPRFLPNLTQNFNIFKSIYACMRDQ